MNVQVALHVACRCGGALIKSECGNCDKMAFRCANCGIMIETCNCYGGPQSKEGCHITTTTTIKLPSCDCPECSEKATSPQMIHRPPEDLGFDSRRIFKD